MVTASCGISRRNVRCSLSHKQKKADGKNHFAEMKSCCGCHIEVKIGVVHVMKPPEDWDHVVGPMPPPIGVIHQEERRDDSGPAGEWEPGQQTDMPIFCPHRDGDRDRQHGETNFCKTGNRKHKVAYEPVQHTEMLASQRKSPLEPEQRNEYASQQWPADIIHEGNFLHWNWYCRW